MQPPEEKEDVTGFVLRVIKGGGRKDGHDGPHEEPEEEIEVDERWLMTYADKMTILCGLFIMLFAMSKMDESKVQKLKESAEKSFGKATLEKAKEFIDPAVFRKVQEENIKLQDQTTKQQEETKQLQKTIATLQEKIETLKPIEKVEPKPVPKDRTPALQKEIKDLVVEKKTLTTENKTLVTENKTLTTEIKELKQTLKTQAQQVQQLTQAAQASSSGGFVAFVMSWDTESHDVDLRIEDPNGKKFNFKNRGTKDYPGRFVIDTRRGPGTEVWQADKLIPGTYKFTYDFYNTYGNAAPCSVTGTLFTQKGSMDLPKIQLDIAGKKSETIAVKMDEDGKMTVLK